MSSAEPITKLSSTVITSRSCPVGTPASLRMVARSSYMCTTYGDDTVYAVSIGISRGCRANASR
jgi:hypothetical protein